MALFNAVAFAQPKIKKPCNRVVNTPHPFVLAAHAENDDVEVVTLLCPKQRFCYQHMPKRLKDVGFYKESKFSIWIQDDDWIPSYLSSETKAVLREEMEREISPGDVPGYIYCFEISNPKAPNQVRLKVGHTANVAKRLSEWEKQCGERLVLQGLWPSTVDGAGFRHLRHQIQPGEKCKYSHRLERLILLELSDLVIHKAYLTPEFLESSKGAEKPSPSSPPVSPRKQLAAKRPVTEKCACGKMHQEIFSFTRVPNSPLKGREWSGIVQPVIERWGRFMEHVYGQ